MRKGKNSGEWYLTHGAEWHLQKCTLGVKEAISLLLELSKDDKRKRKYIAQDKFGKFTVSIKGVFTFLKTY